MCQRFMYIYSFWRVDGIIPQWYVHVFSHLGYHYHARNCTTLWKIRFENNKMYINKHIPFNSLFFYIHFGICVLNTTQLYIVQFRNDMAKCMKMAYMFSAQI